MNESKLIDEVMAQNQPLHAADGSAMSLSESRRFVIRHDTLRYGETSGLKRFGERIVVFGITAEQAEEIAGALTNYCDAGLDDQYEVETAENTPALAIAEYNRSTQEEFRPARRKRQ